MSRRDIYLEDIPLEDALARFWSALEQVGALQPLAGEEVDVADALGRVTAAVDIGRLMTSHV